jgi:branched-chain amino acid transport system ATP-binding protein
MRAAVAERPLLSMRGLRAAIGPFRILEQVDLEVHESETLVLLGRNGAGKTTTLRSIMGFLEAVGGTIELAGEEIRGLGVDEVARRGVAYVPEDRGIFATLTVEENLRVAARPGPVWDRVLDGFPVVRERLGARAGDLSGGQQQMLSVARALLREPRLLLLDEPSTGLAPTVITELVETLRALQSGMTLLLVEQNLQFARELGRRFVILEEGRTVASGPMSELTDDSSLTERYLALPGASESA